jgi:hypothetical protein
MAVSHKSRKTGKHTPVVAVIHKRIRDKEHTKKAWKAITTKRENIDLHIKKNLLEREIQE